MTIPVFVINSHAAQMDVLIKRIDTLILAMGDNIVPGAPNGKTIPEPIVTVVPAVAGDNVDEIIIVQAQPATQTNAATPERATGYLRGTTTKLLISGIGAAALLFKLRAVYNALPPAGNPFVEPPDEDNNDDDANGGPGSPGFPPPGSGSSTDSPDVMPQGPAKDSTGTQTQGIPPPMPRANAQSQTVVPYPAPSVPDQVIPPPPPLPIPDIPVFVAPAPDAGEPVPAKHTKVTPTQELNDFAKSDYVSQNKIVPDLGQSPQQMADYNCSIAGNYTETFAHNVKKPMSFQSAFAATDLNMCGTLASISENSDASKEKAWLMALPVSDQTAIENSTMPLPNYTYMCCLSRANACGYNYAQAKQIATAAEAETHIPKFYQNNTMPLSAQSEAAGYDQRAYVYQDCVAVPFVPFGGGPTFDPAAMLAADDDTPRHASLPPSQTDTDDKEIVVHVPNPAVDPTAPTGSGNPDTLFPSVVSPAGPQSTPAVTKPSGYTSNPYSASLTPDQGSDTSDQDLRNLTPDTPSPKVIDVPGVGVGVAPTATITSP